MREVRINLSFAPRTLNEAKAAEEIIAAVREAVAARGGTVSAVGRKHELTGREDEPWYDHGLVLAVEGSLRLPGPEIPLLKAAE